MKFFIPVLLMAAAAYAQKDECSKQLEEINKDCLFELTPTNVKERCKDLETEKCQNFMKDPFSVVPACKKNPVFSTMINNEIIDSLKTFYILGCSKDDTGKKCPIAEIANQKDYNTTSIK